MRATSALHLADLPLPRHPFEHPLTATLREHGTAPLAVSTDEPIVQSFGLLDHRSRGHAIPAHGARDGHYLAFEDGEQTWLVAIGDKLLHLGRGFAADLRFDNAHVSRSHAIVVRYGFHARVLDDRGANGTFVNGRRVVATMLTDGDVIRLGPVAFRYVTVGARGYLGEVPSHPTPIRAPA